MNGNSSYNGSSLQTYDPVTRTGINTNVIRHTDAPESSGELVAIANASDSEVPTNEHPSKLIALGGTIHGTDQADLDSRIDAFKGIFTKRNKDLDITYGGGLRRYRIMKMSAIGIERQNSALFATFNIEMISKPFGIDTVPTEIANISNHTAATLTLAPTIGGNAPYQMPIFTFSIDSITGTGDYIQITNDLNSQLMLIAGEGLTAADIIVINPETRSVTLNGEEIDYDGTFLEFEPGAQSFTITDGFTTRSIDILIEYYKRYM